MALLVLLAARGRPVLLYCSSAIRLVDCGPSAWAYRRPPRPGPPPRHGTAVRGAVTKVRARRAARPGWCRAVSAVMHDAIRSGATSRAGPIRPASVSQHPPQMRPCRAVYHSNALLLILRLHAHQLLLLRSPLRFLLLASRDRTPRHVPCKRGLPRNAAMHVHQNLTDREAGKDGVQVAARCKLSYRQPTRDRTTGLCARERGALLDTPVCTHARG